ncbi:MAG: respiratory nitrate reductase subunit gamma [Nitrospinota bacterium]|nr:respiratory nitrate reductase subunit gamma [Nitrospinota bacterium]
MEGLTGLSIVFIALCYGAFSLFLVAFLSKVYGYAVTPSPLKIPTTPAPTTSLGVAGRMAGEVFFFTSLFKGNKWTWLGGYLFHLALAAVLLRHLRYFLDPVPLPVALMTYPGLEPGVWAGVVMIAALVYLFSRRLWVDRVKYISLFADYFILTLIGLIGLSGVLMKFVIRTDVEAVKEFTLGLATLHPVNIPPDPMFIIHLLLVLALVVYFPFSKLMHLGGIFFSPTRTQVDDCREIRHVNPWARN